MSEQQWLSNRKKCFAAYTQFLKITTSSIWIVVIHTTEYYNAMIIGSGWIVFLFKLFRLLTYKGQCSILQIQAKAAKIIFQISWNLRVADERQNLCPFVPSVIHCICFINYVLIIRHSNGVCNWKFILQINLCNSSVHGIIMQCFIISCDEKMLGMFWYDLRYHSIPFQPNYFSWYCCKQIKNHVVWYNDDYVHNTHIKSNR